MFHIGQDVICINDRWESYDEIPTNLTVPIKGVIYKIRGFPSHPGAVWIVLEEIVNPFVGDCEPCFNVICFRPVQKRESSEKIVRSLLAPTKVLEKV